MVCLFVDNMSGNLVFVVVVVVAAGATGTSVLLSYCCSLLAPLEAKADFCPDQLGSSNRMKKEEVEMAEGI